MVDHQLYALPLRRHYPHNQVLGTPQLSELLFFLCIFLVYALYVLDLMLSIRSKRWLISFDTIQKRTRSRADQGSLLVLLFSHAKHVVPILLCVRLQHHPVFSSDTCICSRRTVDRVFDVNSTYPNERPLPHSEVPMSSPTSSLCQTYTTQKGPH